MSDVDPNLPSGDEPSPEEFTATEEETASAGGASVRRVVRLVGTLLLIVALLVYFVTPLGRTVWYRWVEPVTRIQLIPPAPQRPAVPRQRA